MSRRTDAIEIVEETIEWLYDLADSEVEPDDDTCGLCTTFDKHIAREYNLLEGEIDTAMKDWPERCKDSSIWYPVPHAEFGAQCAYRLAVVPSASPYLNMWGGCEYGDARRRLCAWVADWLETHMEEIVA